MAAGTADDSPSEHDPLPLIPKGPPLGPPGQVSSFETLWTTKVCAERAWLNHTRKSRLIRYGSSHSETPKPSLLLSTTVNVLALIWKLPCDCGGFGTAGLVHAAPARASIATMETSD